MHSHYSAFTATLQVNNKWHRGKRAPKQASDGGDEGAGEQGVSAMSALPPEVSPSHEDFNPELYLATFHAVSLVSGVSHAAFQAVGCAQWALLVPDAQGMRSARTLQVHLSAA